MTVSIETIEFDGNIVKKFTTDLAASWVQAQDIVTWGCPEFVTSVRYLIVAGGGSGNTAGGGGAGGALTGEIVVIPGTEYTFKIGSGAGWRQSFKCNGANSEAFSLIALGGGGGGFTSTSETAPGASGGSGGGAATGEYKTTVIGGSGTPGQGNDGGSGRSGGGVLGFGGGGGAGGVGGSYSGTISGNGGIGIQSDITGDSIYYAGGGGGGNNAGYTAGSGGLGGGGQGGLPSGIAPTHGVNGFGGGGGGAGAGGGHTPCNGGSGVVILQYHTPLILSKSTHLIVTGSGSLLVQNKLHPVQGNAESPNMLVMRY